MNEFAPYTPVGTMAPEASAANKEQQTPELLLAGTRVLFVAPQPFYEDRGSPIAVLQVLRALSELGIHVDLMTFPVGRSVDVENLRIFRYGTALPIRTVPIGFSLRKVLLDFVLILGLRSRLKAEDYACIHALEDGIFVSLAVRSTARMPIIYDMHSCIPEQLSTHSIFRNSIVQWILKRLERYAIQRSTVVSCSAGLKGYIQSIVPDVPVIEWSFSDPDTDTRELEESARSLRADLGIDADAPVILYAGNFQEYQGVDILIETIPMVRQAHPAAVLVLLGASKGDDIPRLQRRCDGGLIVCPRQPHALVANYLHMAQILVSPRKWGDNLPLKVFEYLAAGKPIVATDNAHHRMVLNEDRAVFASNTPQGLAAAISQLLNDPDKMEHLAAAARAYSETEIGWAKFVESVSRLYRMTLQRRAE